MQAGEPRSLGERILQAQRELSTRLFTAEDRRKVLHLTIDGTHQVKTVDLDPRWAKSIQSQTLAREVLAVYRTAREAASTSAEAACAEIGFAGSVAVQAQEVLRGAMGRVPGTSELMAELEAETVRTERARGNVVAEFKLDGEPAGLEIRPRYAAEAKPEELAAEICACLREGEAAVSRRRAELVDRWAPSDFMEPEARLEEFKQTMVELRTRLG